MLSHATHRRDPCPCSASQHGSLAVLRTRIYTYIYIYTSAAATVAVMALAGAAASRRHAVNRHARALHRCAQPCTSASLSLLRVSVEAQLIAMVLQAGGVWGLSANTLVPRGTRILAGCQLAPPAWQAASPSVPWAALLLPLHVCCQWCICADCFLSCLPAKRS